MASLFVKANNEDIEGAKSDAESAAAKTMSCAVCLIRLLDFTRREMLQPLWQLCAW